jgi:HEAT repeat protein
MNLTLLVLCTQGAIVALWAMMTSDGIVCPLITIDEDILQRLLCQARDDKATRSKDARELEESGPDGLDHLIKALEGTNQGSVIVAARAIGQMGPRGKGGIPALLAVMKRNPNSAVKKACISALATIGDDKTVPELIMLLNGADDKDVRWAAFDALCHYGSEGVGTVPALIQVMKTAGIPYAEKAMGVLAKIGKEATPALVPLIQSREKGDVAIRHKAIVTVGYMGVLGNSAAVKPALPGLIDSLKDKDESIRIAAFDALYHIGPEAKLAFAALQDALTDPSESMRSLAARAMSSIDPDHRAVVPALIELLRAEDRYTRLCGAQELHRLGSRAKAAVPALVKVLGDEYRPARLSAIQALGAIGPGANAAVAELNKLLHDDDPFVRACVASALQRIQPTQPRGK